MKSILIVKLGTTLTKLKNTIGDFDDWIVNRLELPVSQITVTEPFLGSVLPELQSTAGVILTGSHDMVTDNLEWSQRTSKWLTSVIELEIPVFGICYGHQLLAQTLGGTVGTNLYGPEFGSCTATLRKGAKSDPLFTDLPVNTPVLCSHMQSVHTLPEGANLLASTRLCENLAFSIGQCWGVQFHPEFNAHIAQEYVSEFANDLERSGLDSSTIKGSVKEAPESYTLIDRFARYALAVSQ